MIKVFKLLIAVILFVLVFTLYIPVTNALLNSSPSAIGWAEVIVIFSHSVLGLSCYIFFYLLKDVFKINLVLIIVAICLSCIDYPVYNYNKFNVTLILILVRIVELCLVYSYFKKNAVRDREGVLISLLLLIGLIAFYFVEQKI